MNINLGHILYNWSIFIILLLTYYFIYYLFYYFNFTDKMHFSQTIMIQWAL